MEVRNVRWVGIPTDPYAEMVDFLRDVMGLRTNFEEPTTIEFETSQGDEVQLMAPGDPYYVGPPGRDNRWEWIHFRAPDGNLYELASRLPPT